MPKFLPDPTIRFVRIASAPVVSLVLALTMTSCLAPGARDDAEELAAQSRTSDIVPSFTPTQEASTAAPSEPSSTAPVEDDASSGDTAASPDAVEPDTAPEDAGSDPAPEDDGGDAASRQPDPVTSTPSSPARGTTVLSSAVDDAEGDVTATVLEEAPPYADLLGARVELRDAAYEIVITLGADAPEQQPDPDRTMNVAWFADVDGDGGVDHEIWLNLADDGWFPGHRDNHSREARFGEETGIEVEVDGQRLVLRFADDLLGAEGFRWAVGSEWGRYEALGTDAAARDSAPEGHASIEHPA